MPNVVRLAETGGPEVLKFLDVDQVAPASGEVWIEQEAIGVNFLDVTQRNGAVPIPLPSGLGIEGAGRVTAVGPNVTHVEVGARVVYALGPLGSYASGRLYPANRAIVLPDAIGFTDAAAIFLKALTAQYLVKTTYPVRQGTVVLLYGAAGALGQIIASWAKKLGATVIGVVSKESSASRAQAAGCDAVLIWGECDLPAEVARLTAGRKADVVYDGVGKTTFDASLDSLRTRGVMVSMGASSGVPEAVSVSTLNARGSLFLTRPSLVGHINDIEEYHGRAADVFDAIDRGLVTPSIWKSFAFKNAVEVHETLENGKSAGAIVMIP